jgi:hypothetical protein
VKQTALTDRAEELFKSSEADIVQAEKLAREHGGKMAMIHVHLASALCDAVLALACQVADGRPLQGPDPIELMVRKVIEVEEGGTL